MRINRKRKQIRAARLKAQDSKRDFKQPVAAHIDELRRRFFYIACSLTFFGAIAYGFEQPLIKALLRPARGQQFIYTSPVGAVDFLFKICLYSGIAASIPFVIYHCLKYLEPLIGKESSRFIYIGSAVSGILAVIGIVFGYFVGLPDALHFLLHQFVIQQIKPLVTIQSYISFVAVYMLGSALLLQAPLILIFINRIKPLDPKSLIKNEKWIVAASFIVAGLMNPTPNIFALLIIVLPLLLMYQLGIGIIWYINRKGEKPAFIEDLLARDADVQTTRFEAFMKNRAAPVPLNAIFTNASPAPKPAPVVAATATPSLPDISLYRRPVQRRPIDSIRYKSRRVSVDASSSLSSRIGPRPVQRRYNIDVYPPNRNVTI